jgi:hypothetical protein
MAAGRSISTRPLTGKEQAAWRVFVRALTVAPRVLDADLLEASRLNTAEYHVLELLSEQPEHGLRMSELAAQAALTRSGLTRAVERLTRRGLVEGTRSQSDGRGRVAADRGRRASLGDGLSGARAQRAHPGHAASAPARARRVHRRDERRRRGRVVVGTAGTSGIDIGDKAD